MAVKNNKSKEELQSLKSSTYIYSHPENIINNEDVRCDPKQSVCNSGWWSTLCDWLGDDYRPMFKEIKRLRSVIPCAKILALSATLSTHGQLKNVKVVSSKPTKNNISLIMVPRPPLTTLVSTKDTFGYVFVPLLCELKSKGQEFPLTLVYCSGNIDWVGYGFEITSKVLDKDMFEVKVLKTNG